MIVRRFAAIWNRLQSWLSGGRVATATLALQLALPAPLLAQSQSSGPKVHGNTIPYLLVVLCLALGLVLLCRSSSRTKEVRLPELEED